MIQIGELTLDLNDPIVQAGLVGAALVLLLFVLLISSVRASARAARLAEPLVAQVGSLGTVVQNLVAGQERLTGGLETVSQFQTQSAHVMDQRLAAMQQHMNDSLQANALKSATTIAEFQQALNVSLHGSSEKTTKSLTELQERLATIDKAQTNIEKLSGDVLSLQDILSNKQTRGAFGEIQLNDIVTKALPSDSYEFQVTLSNGKRADCLISLPNPPGPIVIDAKFPLEPYEALVAAQTKDEAARALSALKVAVRKHIKDISERYLIDGETADGALMFVPSEAVYAELHARLPEIVREGFDARVWIVSPTTCMATLNTMRAILKDARMREQAGAIRKELGMLYKDVERLGTRVDNLDKHFALAVKDVAEIKVSAQKASGRAHRLDRFEFDEVDSDETNVVAIERP